MSFKVTKAFKVSENHVDVDSYTEGEYETLPPVALNFGLKYGFVEELDSEAKTTTTENESSDQTVVTAESDTQPENSKPKTRTRKSRAK